jgi:hypothetical protein
MEQRLPAAVVHLIVDCREVGLIVDVILPDVERRKARRAGSLFGAKRRDAEPTNNESERALRPSVIFRKMTKYATLCSIVENGRRNGRSALTAKRSVEVGRSVAFILPLTAGVYSK